MPESIQVIDGVASVRLQAPRSQNVQSDICSTPSAVPVGRSSLTTAERRQIEEFAFRYGSAPESYDISASSGFILRLGSGAGFVNVYSDKRIWHIPGGLIADDSQKPPMVAGLKQLAEQRNLIIAAYSVDETDVALFRDAGFVVNKFGEEPMLDLGEIDWRGKSFEWVRRQTNFCRRQGLSVIEVQSPAEQRSLAPELLEVLMEDLKDRVYSRPLKLLDGVFDPYALGRRRLFIVRNSREDRIEGFLAASPMNGGDAWAFETYRKRADAFRGTIPFLFREVTDRLQAEGVQRVSLCLVPGKGVEGDICPPADVRLRWLLKLWYGRLNILFSASGQDYFKSRFRPRYVDRYVCVYPGNTWLSFLSFVRTAGALDVNIRNWLRKLSGSFGFPEPNDRVASASLD